MTVTFLLLIGTNYETDANLSAAQALLKHEFQVMAFSRPLETEAIGMAVRRVPFTNQLVLAEREFDDAVGPAETAACIVATLKSIERKIGRRPEDKAKEIIKIDLDLMKVGDKIYNPDLMEKPFVKALLSDFYSSL